MCHGCSTGEVSWRADTVMRTNRRTRRTAFHTTDDHQAPREMQMTDHPMEARYKEIFRALVELQDQGCATESSRIRIADQFCISVSEVQHVEREGIAKKWPPLSDDNDKP